MLNAAQQKESGSQSIVSTYMNSMNEFGVTAENSAQSFFAEGLRRKFVQTQASDGRSSGFITLESPKLVQQIMPVGSKHILTQMTAAAVAQQMNPSVSEQTAAEVNLQSLPNDTSVVHGSNSVAGQFQEALRSSASAETSKPAAMTMSAQQFAEEMSQFVFKNMKITQMQGLTEAKITLTPEHLGQVDVRISLQNGHLVAQFMADTALGKEMLENQLPILRHTLQAQGLQVDKLEVHQQSEQAALFQDQRHQQSAHQQSQRQAKNQSQDYDNISGEFVADLELQLEARQLVYGNQFNVTA
jgi:flagellar hook-length control protein FliK